MCRKKFEQVLVEHCAPTLAGVKTANLFRYVANDFENIWEYTYELSAILKYRGISVEVIKECSYSKTFLIYVYRPAALVKDFSKPGVENFLVSCGYNNCTSIDDYISKLSQRLYESGSFPHEIGIFLSYPLHDVLGFIENKGQKFKCCGCWKVYQNKTVAEKCFQRYKQCAQIYKKLYSKGKTIMELAVAA